MTTAVSFPRIATAVIPEPVMALKAYSYRRLFVRTAGDHMRGGSIRLSGRTDLVETTWREEEVGWPSQRPRTREWIPAARTRAYENLYRDIPSGEKTVRYLLQWGADNDEATRGVERT